MQPIVVVFFKRKLFALWILFTLSFLPGLFKFNILFLNILLVLIGIIPYSGLTGLNNIFYIYIYIEREREREREIDNKVIHEEGEIYWEVKSTQ